MRSAAFMLVLSCVIVSCGKKEEPTPAASAPKKTFSTEDAKPAAGTPGATEAAKPIESAVNPEEARRIATVKKLQDRVKAAKTDEQKVEALEKIEQLGARAPEAAALLDKAAAEEKSAEVRAAALRARAAVTADGLQLALAKALADPDAEVRQAAADGFKNLKGAASLDPIFLRIGLEKDDNVQTAMMLAVEKLGDDSTAEKVAAILRDQAKLDTAPISLLAIRAAARFLFSRPAAAKPHAEALLYFLGRSDAELRSQICQGLATLDVRTKPVVDEVIKTLSDPEVSVRRAAFDLLQKWAGDDFGYDPEAETADRLPAVDKWKAWAEKRGG